MINSDYLTTKEAATFLKVSSSTLARWRQQGKGPSFSRLDTGSILYVETTLRNYVEQNIVYRSH